VAPMVFRALSLIAGVKLTKSLPALFFAGTELARVAGPCFPATVRGFL
jgi:hypothetical protein